MSKLLSFKLSFTHFLLFFILIVAFLLRIYRLNDTLLFNFDQGRDALVIWDFIKNGNLFLIGPTTGIEGIFRGPWYYWLITPFYFLGRGDPIWPAVFLALTTIVAIIILYKLGEIIAGQKAGIMAAIIGGFSYVFMASARWLSNPTPMYLISVLLIYSVYLVTQGKNKAWILIGFLLGIAMQFGSAAEVFYFPSVVIFALLNKKNWPTKKNFLLSIGTLLIVFLPQIIFDIKNDGILSNNIKKFLFEKESFSVSFWEVAKVRLAFYYDVFVNKIFPVNKSFGNPLLLVLLFSFLINLKNLWKIQIFRLVTLLVTIPLFGMLFFQGNEGNVYDYYFTGYYFIYALFASVLLVKLFEGRLNTVLVSIFLLAFLAQNTNITSTYLTLGTDGPDTISFVNQKKIVDWVYNDSRGQDFNVDVYVPPVIPHSYDYLLKWRGEKYEMDPSSRQVKLLYTLHEADNMHPKNLSNWLERQRGIGEIEKSQRFGGITVERRNRLGGN